MLTETVYQDKQMYSCSQKIYSEKTREKAGRAGVGRALRGAALCAAGLAASGKWGVNVAEADYVGV